MHVRKLRVISKQLSNKTTQQTKEDFPLLLLRNAQNKLHTNIQNKLYPQKCIAQNNKKGDTKIPNLF
jgi:hypothetical protein